MPIPKAGAGGKLKEGEMAGAGGLKENEVEAAGMLSRLKEAAEAEGEVAAVWGLPKSDIVGQAKELKF